MKYGVGDYVRVKPKEWYDREKDSCDDVWGPDGYNPFVMGMSKYCGRIVKVSFVNLYDDGIGVYYTLGDGIGYHWEDWMLEDVVIENVKECAL
jgi:hypothetical protein